MKPQATLRRALSDRNLLGANIAALCSHTDTLVPGETGLVLIIAPDQRQALIVLEYIAAAFAATPMLSQLVASRTADTLTLTNRASIEVRSASFRRLRGENGGLRSRSASMTTTSPSLCPHLEAGNRPSLR
jgi:hypothetical protein